jgi:anti-anti-sigma regulatory factor
MVLRGPVEHAVLELSGELDFTYAADVGRVIAEHPHRIVTVDLSGLEFVDVPGARAIAALVQDLTERNGEAPDLHGVAPAVERALAMVDPASRPVAAV